MNYGKRSCVHARFGPLRLWFSHRTGRRDRGSADPHGLHVRFFFSHSAVTRVLYAYHHYLGPPDRFDDCGWGCAYRSCQTLISALCGPAAAAAAATPTVLELQRALVAMGDKPAGFAGSREWIGAVEVGLLVEHHTGQWARPPDFGA